MITKCLEQNCSDAWYKRGYCNKHYLRRKRSGMPLGPHRKAPNNAMTQFIKERATYQGDDCFAWGSSAKQSVLVRSTAPYKGSNIPASRVMCILAHGEPKFPEAQAAHSCGNEWCLNPTHLRWATQTENEADKLSHGTRLRGERQNGAKLTEQKVLSIAREMKTAPEVAYKYGCTIGQVHSIRSGKTWNWLTGITAGIRARRKRVAT